MKKTFAILLLSFFALQACKKETRGTDRLTGKWKLIEVYSNALSSTVPRPADATGDFIVVFYNDNAFSGNTFRNSFEDGSYTLSNTTELRFGAFSATKIQEDAWGVQFNGVLLSCLLQSVSPCTPSVISIQDKKLVIMTPFYSKLTFEKVY